MNEFISLFVKYLPDLLRGLEMTIAIAVLALFFGVILGLIFGLMSISKNKLLTGIATFYVGLIRGIPVFVLAMYLYFGIPALFGFTVPAFNAAIIILAINSSAFLCEIFRGGIQAVDFGQMEAARSLGIPYTQTMTHVILPQAVKIMVPSIMNQFISTLKDTSILSIITVRELMMNSQIIVSRTFQPFYIYTYAVIFYLIMVTALTILAKIIERKMKYDHRG